MAHGNDSGSGLLYLWPSLLHRESIWNASPPDYTQNIQVIMLQRLADQECFRSFTMRSHSLPFFTIRCSFFWPDIGQLAKWGLWELCLYIIEAVRVIGGAEGGRTLISALRIRRPADR